MPLVLQRNMGNVMQQSCLKTLKMLVIFLLLCNETVVCHFLKLQLTSNSVLELSNVSIVYVGASYTMSVYACVCVPYNHIITS